MTKQQDILNLKRRIRHQRKQIKRYALDCSEINFKKYQQEDVVQIMRAIYKEIFNEKPQF
tara:strand:+ start:222 stop:401 length:180 start_codon:yes stop_codon:yes gene_type:complete